ncbi:MAG TPA: crossover junction endodeoxyribonuclease RuvC [Polyangiaceae bacterium]|nr:MAG: Crossover junction endodeoxyribonuclease RuvC [Deltaproteobacteria bacterium ADurb.Bin207]HNS96117.1 crossover junction endodeoxyribonuclease RuvC [Polyangiaceae bacterium]HNZ22152.1 crossover junction endodeoxyribonuclease RuvC [Polyangiaceae bacterium]HOD21352.1 crossover junction endodeoxyribonuclease RuvC [Polyangiaceae bacterium]HOE46976.1 crossover junction endodeoxyribonuclease RuvC [Polyangiaceae bacterium]
MRVIGIDPGTRHLGWGIVRVQGTRLSAEDYGIVDLDGRLSIAERLLQIDRALGEILRVHEPEVAAVESLFFAKDAQAASKLGHARGVILLLLAKAAIPIHEVEPARVKRAVTGRGRADKRQVALMVKAVLGLRELPGVDATDALAVAITHAQQVFFERAVHRGGR